MWLVVLNAGCDLLLLCNEREGVIQVLDNLKLEETTEHFVARQERLKSLFKQKSFDWSELTKTSHWIGNHQKLTALQQEWLASK